MTFLSDSFSANPSTLVPLAAAGVAASVAFLVGVLTQFATSKREQTKLLIAKLEELYLLLNKSAQDNVARFDAVDKWFHGKPDEKFEIQKIDDLYGLNHNKKIIMFIRLYFPQLSFLHQQLFHAQQDLNSLCYSLLAGQPARFESFKVAVGRIGHFLRLIESEIISNRKKLTSDYWILCRYKGTPQTELEYVHNPPPGPVSTRSDQSATPQAAASKA
ncbi:hypothetical protein KBB96_07025 [Luteolibacter ambystomatis]|uniref:Uncharacterized protein n=1 Tax=Luteolibacter ambystomatis TaxID=2824561 RepID=A0A975J247_9BACT|nr:hypothetical protein [Luteolibacter ambystomatis]QUE52640.1 hypothetical protein KBB96_07025 [Luteolibacter ambystomatis]